MSKIGLDHPDVSTQAASPLLPQTQSIAVESNVLLACQPIFDARVQACGYELLYRTGSANAYLAGESTGMRSTATVIVNSLLNVGVDSLAGSKLAFINVDREMLLSGCLWALPHDRMVLEILETVEPDEKVIAACQEAKQKGFTLAMDDVTEQSQGNPLFSMVDIVKVDFRATSPAARKKMVSLYGRGKTIMLAEKVETEEEFREAVSWGYQYFQGYFLARPKMVTGSAIPTGAATLLRILSELAQEDVALNSLEKSIQPHVRLTYKLMRYLNSGAFAFRDPIRSLGHALALLGVDQLRKVLTLMILADIHGERPRELVVIALQRARMLEALGPRFNLPNRGASLFLMGMFSLLDAILRRPLSDVLSELNLEADIADALLGHGDSHSALRRLFALVIAYEQADWGTVEANAAFAHLDLDDLAKEHLLAQQWARETAPA
jgi:EAL and modified HD-GYP domain-containing signal transduction protein